MADRCLHFTGTAPGRFPTRRLGLPQPAPLRRRPLETRSPDGPLLHLTAGDSAVTEEFGALLADTGPEVATRAGRPAGIAVDATTAWFAQPASTAVNGQIVRVCGQNLLGA